jgi:hypothetical protein
MVCWSMLKHKFQKWLELTAEERTLLFIAFFLLPFVKIIRLGDFSRLQKIMGSLGLHSDKQKACKTGTLDKARRAARMVSIAAAYSPIAASCLDRSLLLRILLQRQGIDSSLFFGVRKDQGNFEAHAWVEIDGTVLNDTPDVRERYAPFPAPIKG